MLKLRRDGVRERKIILKLRSRTPWLLQDCPSLSARLGLTAESGLEEFSCAVRSAVVLGVSHPHWDARACNFFGAAR
jgi:hypothetical protein